MTDPVLDLLRDLPSRLMAAALVLHEAHMLDEESAAKRALEDARAIASSRGVRVRARVLRARVAGEAIVEEAESSDADVIVLRAPRSGRRWKMFGRTVDHILKHAPCRVMVDAPPPA